MSTKPVDRVSAYGGVAGEILDQSISFFSIVAAIAVGVVLIVVSIVLGLVGADRGLMLVVQLFLAVVVAKTARSVASGDFGGSLLGDTGGSWVDAFPTAVRYLLLSMIWLLPLTWLMPGPRSGAGLGPLMNHPALFVLLALASLLTPPLFLIVSLTASEFSDIFQPRHWQAVFRGRGSDLLLVFSAYVGGIVVIAFLAFAPVMLFMKSPGTAITMLALAGAFLLGLAVLLLGRLCGAFVLTHGETLPWFGNVAPTPEPPASLRPRMSTAGVPSPVIPALRPGAPPVMAQAPPPIPAAAIVPQVAATKPSAAVGQQKRMLLDLPQRIEEAWQCFERDPRAGIAQLEELNVSAMTPSPQLLHALVLMRQRAGDEAGAMSLAPSALALILEKGNVRLAAEVFRALFHRAAELGYSRDQLLAFGASLQDGEDFKTAANAFAMLLQRDANDARAVKGLIAAGDALLQQPGGREDARRLFAYLLRRCPDTPHRDFIKERLDKAERSLTQV